MLCWKRTNIHAKIYLIRWRWFIGYVQKDATIAIILAHSPALAISVEKTFTSEIMIAMWFVAYFYYWLHG